MSFYNLSLQVRNLMKRGPDLALILIILVIIVVIWLILREVRVWYWKIDRRIQLQEETNYLLKLILTELRTPGGD